MTQLPSSPGDRVSSDPVFSDPGAILDLGRRRRLGMVEAVWGEHKSAAQISAIAWELLATGETVLVTRVHPAKAREVLERLAGPQAAAPAAGRPGPDPRAASGVPPMPEEGAGPPGGTVLPSRDASARPSAAEGRDGPAVRSLTYHPEAACLCSPLPEPASDLGRVVVLGGGSSDLTVASEALLALRAHRVPCELLLDVGVAGLHRLLDRLDRLRSARVLIACAGMEGALPTVLAGLLPQPVIAVPVSVGYGVSAGGVAALHGMLASCAPGLTVVNIDNGYGAAMAALRILGARG